MQASPTILNRLRPGLGTLVAVEAEAARAGAAEEGLAAAFEAVSLVERLMHPQRGSDMQALCTAACGVPLAVHPWTWEVLALSRRLHGRSHGIFDPCLSTADGRIGDLDLSRRGRVVCRAPVRIDLGGIAKGYAVDRAIDALRSAGCTGGLVNAGGDLALFGARRRTILCSRPDGTAAALELRSGAIASSDTAQPSRPPEHRGYYHAGDRARPVSGQVTVVAHSAAIADGLTKCLLCGGHRLSRALLLAFGARTLAPRAQKARPRPRSSRVKSLLSSNH